MKDCISAENFCILASDLYFIKTGLNPYDIRTSITTKNTYPPSDYMLYLANPEVMKAIGAQKNYVNCSMDTFDLFYTNGDK